jgi:hypothetical protein
MTLLELQFFRYDTTGSSGFADDSPNFAASSPVYWSDSPTGLNLVVDLYFYPLQQHKRFNLTWL